MTTQPQPTTARRITGLKPLNLLRPAGPPVVHKAKSADGPPPLPIANPVSENGAPKGTIPVKALAMAKEAAQNPAPTLPAKVLLTADGEPMKRTPNGRAAHTPHCGCLKNKTTVDVMDDPKGRALTPCKKCRPTTLRAEIEAMTGKRAGARTFTACATCMRHGMLDYGELTEAETHAHGLSITKSGTKYHTAECRFVGGAGYPKPVAKKREPKVKASKTTTTTAQPNAPPQQ